MGGNNRMSKRHVIQFMERMLPDFIYDISVFENNPMTIVEVLTLLDGITVGGHRITDEKMILNLKQSYSYVFRQSKESNKDYESVLKNIHLQCAINLVDCIGRFRTTNIKMTGTKTYKCPKSDNLEHIFNSDFQDILDIEDTVDSALTMLCWLIYNQFFIDCNKRTARLFANYLLINRSNACIQIHRRDSKVFKSLLIEMFDTKETKNIKKFLIDKCVMYFKEDGTHADRTSLQYFHNLYGKYEIDKKYCEVFGEVPLDNLTKYKQLYDYLEEVETASSLKETSIFIH